MRGPGARSGGLLTVGQLTSFLSYANQYTKPFNEISGVVTELQNALACAGRVFDLIDEETIPEEAPGTEALGDVEGTGGSGACVVLLHPGPAA